MIAFPHCKINLGLNVVSKRADGFHDIETCFYPVHWRDVLEIIPSTETRLNLSGISIPGDVTKNIALKAYELLRMDFNLEPIEIYLHKIIPHGAGLGGGSSDGAHALKLVNQLFELNLTINQLKSYALKLGSDCPFFIEPKPMLATGRGEILTPISMDLSGFNLLIVKPPVGVSTAEAYSNIVPTKPVHNLESILSEPISNWKSLLKNDFEETIFKNYPIISELKDKLYNLGAEFASMSGSGSAVFGIFKNKIEIGDGFPDSEVWQGNL
jgi:4-diphosphocytidyl-2-C-methyl-D-erythritol kinase